MTRRLAGLSLTALIGVVSLISTAWAQQAAQTVRPANNILAHALDVETGRAVPRPHEAHLSSGPVYAALTASGDLESRAQLAPLALLQSFDFSQNRPTVGCSNVFSSDDRTNIRVNQDCSRRRQAEEVIAVNPTDPTNLIAGQNDSRVGFNHCGYDFSFDGGRTWGDQVPPFYQFILKDGHTADACSDPSVSFDSAGNAYIAGLLFDINSPASALVALKSNAGIGGAFFHSPAPGPFQTFTDTPTVIASDNNPDVAHDKEFIVADSQLGSIKKNNVYASWTRFANTGVGVGGDSPIVFSQSVDGGVHWSSPIEISGASTTLCLVGSGESNPNACDQDQGSDPIVGPDGTVYVTFGNGNTPGTTNQILIVSCPFNADCSKAASWTTPVKVADLFDLQPSGTAAGCPAGRQCLPPNGYRLDDFVTITVSIDQAKQLFVTWADFRNGKANCMGPNAAPPCDNDVFYSFSVNNGATWSAARKLTPAGSAQWQPWSIVSPDGSKLFVAYYDRSYGPCETTGCNDITLATVERPTSASPDIDHRRITTSSMPNLTATNNPVQAGFLGDYMWITLDGQGRPNIVWADTRGLNGTVEEDVYFSRVSEDGD